jgi:cytochrome c oxidase cbb3-type subunit I
MTTTVTQETSPAAAFSAEESTAASASRTEQIIERSLIDASTRGPVLTFFATALGWLLVSTFLGILVTIKVHSPGFLADVPWLTYGRVLPAYNNAFLYGWCSLAGMGVAIWLMARLCRVSIRAPGAFIYGAALWNIGVLAGVAAILGGDTRALEGLEMPRAAHILMFIGFVLIGLGGAVLYRFRRQSAAFISVWYLLGALFWFPWTFATANVLVGLPQVRGVMESIVSAWYVQNLHGWWITSIGLAAAYFLIPKVINKPIHSYNLASVGFWSFAILSGLTGMVRLSGGPVPAWLVTLSIAASIMMLVPVACVTVNLLTTMHGSTNMVYHSPTIRFTYFGAIAFAVASIVGILGSLRSLDRILHFTQFTAAHQHMLLYAFFSMVIFGAIYYITPRLVGCEWLSSSMISMHFWGAAYGGSMAILMLLFSGLTVGLTFIDPTTTWAQVIEIGRIYAWGRTVATLFITVGHLAFALHFLLMLLRIGQPGGEPTLFAPLDEDPSH